MKLPKDLIIEMAKYYSHRRSNELLKSKWNKEKDLDNITKAASRHQFTTVAISGSFWFFRNGKTYEFNEFNYTN